MVNHLDSYPFASRWYTIGDHRLHFIDEGQGEPLVFLHGNPTWSFLFRKLISGLRQNYRCVAPDHIGCGLSDKPVTNHYGYRLADRVRDLDSLLNHLNLRKNLTLVVHDWGGMIGLAWAVQNPERVKRLVIFNTAAFPLPGGKRIPWQIWIARQRVIGPLLVQGLNGFVKGLVKTCSVRPLSASASQGFLAPYDSWDHRIAVWRFVEDIPLRQGDPSFDLVRDTEAGLIRFKSLPMLICWGLRDFVFDISFLEEWKKRFPEAECHQFEDAGHLLLEDSGEKIIELMKDFLQRNSLPHIP